MIYLINLLIIPVYYWLFSFFYKKKEKRNNVFFAVFGIHAILFRALANPLNYVDTEGYALAYSDLAQMSFMDAVNSFYSMWGLGYVIINWCLTRISNDPMMLFTFVTIVTVGGIVWFYKKTSYFPIATVLIFVLHPMLYYMSFGVIRQPFSIVFLLFALYYIDNWKVSIPLSIFAVFLHTSSIVFLPFFLWRYFKLENRGLVVVVFFSIVGFFFLRIMMGDILAHLERYQQTGFGEEGENNVVPNLLLGITILLFYLSNTHSHLKDGIEKNVFSFITYGFMVSLFGFGMHGAGRLTLVFIYVLPVAITYLKKYSREKLYFYSFYSLILLLLCYMIISSYNPIKYDYISIWELVKDYK